MDQHIELSSSTINSFHSSPPSEEYGISIASEEGNNEYTDEMGLLSSHHSPKSLKVGSSPNPFDESSKSSGKIHLFSKLFS